MNNIMLKYAVLQYMPDQIRRESINVGVVFHCPSQRWSKFKRIKNISRLRSFDDEYDIEYLNLIFESLSYEFDSEKLDEYGFEERFAALGNENFLAYSTKFYVNEFNFLPVETLFTNFLDFDKDIEDIVRTFLYYDRPKGERITTNEVRKLMKRQFSQYSIKNELTKQPVKDDFLSQNIFDFSFDNKCFKAISFDKSKTKDLAKELKVFLYDLDEQKETLQYKKVYIIIDNKTKLYEADEIDFYQFYDIFKRFSQKIDSEYKDIVEIVSLSDFSERLIIGMN